MVYEIRGRKPEPTLLSIQGIINLLHNIGIVKERVAFDDAVWYTQWGEWIAAQLNVMAVMGFVSRVTNTLP